MESKKKKEKMKQLIKLGNKMLGTGKYNIALDNYNEIYTVTHLPVLFRIPPTEAPIIITETSIGV